MCRWNEWLKSSSLSLPENLEDIPDIFVYLVTEADRPVCFKRIKPYTIFKGTGKDDQGRPIDEIELKGFDEVTSWEILEEDKAIDALDAGE